MKPTKKVEQHILQSTWIGIDSHNDIDPQQVTQSLLNLIYLDDSSESEMVAEQFVNSIGNNHYGIYYPIITELIDHLLVIEKYTESKVCKMCTKCILNDLYYFEPDIGESKMWDVKSLKDHVQKKLSAFSDEHFDIPNTDLLTSSMSKEELLQLINTELNNQKGK